MKTKHIIITVILFTLSFNAFAKISDANYTGDNPKEVFTAKDKDYLQLWHYDQVLKMDLNEEARDEYFSLLNQYTFNMSNLGLPKYSYTKAERKQAFEKLAKELDADMKKHLSAENYSIHQTSFDMIEQIVYEKRNWED